jgi:hypothetical protein
VALRNFKRIIRVYSFALLVFFFKKNIKKIFFYFLKLIFNVSILKKLTFLNFLKGKKRSLGTNVPFHAPTTNYQSHDMHVIVHEYVPLHSSVNTQRIFLSFDTMFAFLLTKQLFFSTRIGSSESRNLYGKIRTCLRKQVRNDFFFFLFLNCPCVHPWAWAKS